MKKWLLAWLFLNPFLWASAQEETLSEELIRLVRLGFDTSQGLADRMDAIEQADALMGEWLAVEVLSDEEGTALVKGAYIYLNNLNNAQPRYTLQYVSPYLTKAIAFCFRSGDNANESELIHKAALACLNASDLDLAREFLSEQALQRLRKDKAAFYRWCELEEARLSILEGDLLGALRNLDRLVESEKPAGEDVGVISFELYLEAERVNLNINLGLLDVAQRIHLRHKELADTYQLPQIRHTAHLHEVHLMTMSGRYKEAYSLATRLAAEYDDELPEEERGIAGRQVRCLYELLLGAAKFEESLRNSGQSKLASEHLRAAIRMGELPPRELSLAHAMLAQVALLDRRMEAAIEEVELASAHAHEVLDGMEDGVYLPWSVEIESTRSTVFRLAGVEDPLDDGLSRLLDSYDGFLRLWSMTPLQVGGIGYLQYREKRFVLSEVVSAVLAADDSESSRVRALELVMRAQAMGTSARLAGLSAGSVENLQSMLVPKGCGLFVLVPGRWNSHVFLVSAKSVEHFEIGSEHQLGEVARSFATSVLKRPSSSASGRSRAMAEVRQTSKMLVEQLLPEPVLERVLAWEQIAFVGTDLLGYLPLEALWLDEVWLGTAKTIAYLPSLPLGLWYEQRQDSSAFKEPLVVAGVPQASEYVAKRWPGLSELPVNRERLEKIAFSTTNAPTLLQEDFTRTKLEGLDCEALCLITHGVVDSMLPRPTGLVVTPDESLQAGVMFSQDFDSLWKRTPRVVVLAACGASQAPRLKGDDGSNHLGGTLLSAGVRTVVLSPGRLDYEATVSLLEEFAPLLRAGAPPAEAMRIARKQVAAQEAFEHPHFTCMLSVWGLGY